MNELRIGTLFTVLLPLLLIAEAIVGVMLWRVSGHPMPEVLRRPMATGVGHIGAEVRLVAMWVAVTAATLWVGFLVAFVGCHLLLFTIGQPAALVGLIASVVVLGATPVAWAFFLFHRARR
jgi:hypothetical protein